MTYKIQKNLITKISGFLVAISLLIGFLMCISPNSSVQAAEAVATETACVEDENGFCTVHSSHYEAPVFILEDQQRTFYIENEEQWLHLAIAINEKQEIFRNGYYEYIPEQYIHVKLTEDLDFSHMTFIPMGDHSKGAYITGEFSCVGGNHTVSGISYSSDSAEGIGLFGYAKNFEINQYSSYILNLNNCSFSGDSNVGAFVGYAENVVIKNSHANNIEIQSNNGNEGAFFGYAENSEIEGACLSIDVVNGDGKNLAFSSNDEGLTVGDFAFCLYETDGENGKTSLETFRSGKVAYKLRDMNRENGRWSQIVDKTEENGNSLQTEDFPRYILKESASESVYPVYSVSDCNGNTLHYTNNASKDSKTHVPGEINSWIWGKYYDTCEAMVVCKECHAEELMNAEVAWYDTRWVPVRISYIAKLPAPTGGYYTNESGEEFSDIATVISIKIETMIGMRNREVVYNVNGVSPEELMDNHRLNPGNPSALKEYEVWFINAETGEKIVSMGWVWNPSISREEWGEIPGSAVDVGTYHLLVVGKRGYEGQEYIFENALVIKPVVVELAPNDVFKYYDGNAKFEPSYSFLNPEHEAEYGGYNTEYSFEIVFDDAASSAEGVYEIPVTVKNKLNEKNIRFVLTRDKVSAAIVPQLFVELENKDYPTEFIYGDVIPAPSADYFNVTEGSTLTFEWYLAEFDYFDEIKALKYVDEIKNAGKYVLRVYASSVGNLAASQIDILVTVSQKSLGLEFVTDGVTVEEHEYYPEETVYVLEQGQSLGYNISGFVNGDTAETANVYVEADLPTEAGTHYVIYYLRCRNSIGYAGNYEEENFGCYVKITDSEGGEDEPGTGADPEAETKEIVMNLKPFDYEISSGEVKYDPKMVIMEAGKVIALEHRLESVRIVVDAVWGKAYIAEIKVVDENGNDVSHLYSLKSEPVTIHVFDSPCDAECNISNCYVGEDYERYTRVAFHMGGEATCTKQAKCEVCNAPYGELDRSNHDSEATHIAPNGNDPETHLLIHSCCGTTSAVLPHTIGTEATCTSRAVCADCGWQYGEIDPDNHTHTPVYVSNGESEHTASYSCCGHSDVQNHSGGEATCKSGAVCEHCSAIYGEKNPDNHAENSVLEYKDEKTHIETHKCCGDFEEFPHVGGEATCKSLAVCEGCKSEYGSLNFRNHTSDEINYTVRADNASMHDVTHACCGTFIRKAYHSGGEATCKSAAVCEYCHEEYGAEKDHSKHVSDQLAYKQDNNSPNIHIVYHACCGEEIEREEHSGGEATCLAGEVCEYCGKEYGESLSHVFDNDCDSVCNSCNRQVRPLVFHKDDDGNKSCDVCKESIYVNGLEQNALPANQASVSENTERKKESDDE